MLASRKEKGSLLQLKSLLSTRCWASQIIVAIPQILLYEISIFISTKVEKQKCRVQENGINKIDKRKVREADKYAQWLFSYLVY